MRTWFARYPSLTVGLLAFIASVVVSPVLPLIEWLPTDILFWLRFPESSSGLVSVCEIESGPITRTRIAKIVELLKEREAEVVALDFLFAHRLLDGVDGGGTRALEKVLENGNVVVGFALYDKGNLEGHSELGLSKKPPDGLLKFAVDSPDRDWPGMKKMLAAEVQVELAGKAAALGSINNLEYFKSVQHASLISFFDGWYFPSLSLAAVKTYHQADSMELRADSPGFGVLVVLKSDSELERFTVTAEGLLRINHRRFARQPPRFGVDELTACEQKSDDECEGLSNKIRGRIVFVGSTRPSEDRYTTPFWDRRSGVAIHANIADNLLKKDYIRDESFWSSSWLIASLLIGQIMSLLTFRFGRALFALAVLPAWWIICWVSFAFGNVLWNLSAPTFSGLLAFVLASIWKRRDLERMLARFRSLAGRRLYKNLTFKEWLGGKSLGVVTMVFTEVANLSRLVIDDSEDMAEGKYAEYLKKVEGLAFMYEGYDVNWFGDWGLSVFLDPRRAVKFARKVVEISAGEGVRVRSGVHCGSVNVFERQPFGPNLELVQSMALSLSGRSESSLIVVSSAAKEDIERFPVGSSEELIWKKIRLRDLGSQPMWLLLDESEVGEKLSGMSVAESASENDGEFDVFLCYGEEDQEEVEAIAQELRGAGLRPWLPDTDLRPGFSRQRGLERAISDTKAAAVFIGAGGLDPWAEAFQEAFFRKDVGKECPLIPVILPGVDEAPELPVFLSGNVIVYLNGDYSEGFDRLVWGITGKKPDWFDN